LTSELDTSVGFSLGWAQWLKSQKISLAVTGYSNGGLYIFGVKLKSEGGDLQPAALQRFLDRATGLATRENELWLTTRTSVLKFSRVTAPDTGFNEFDALYLPRLNHFTGDFDAHEIAICANGSPLIVATKLNSVVALDERFNCQPVYRPPFISAFKLEDCCHLNGLAMRDGQLAYVSSFGVGDVIDSWRDRRLTSGVIVDVNNGEVVLDGLSMPHSPRLFDAGDGERLYFLNSGHGTLCRFDPSVGSSSLEEVCFLPGFLRGLAFHGQFAFATTSLPDNHSTEKLQFLEELERRNAQPQCAVFVIDLTSGSIVHSVRFTGHMTELFDVAVLPGIERPYFVGLNNDEIAQFHAFDQAHQ
jgi:uncharacterized protein (TIGR03032 family)